MTLPAILIVEDHPLFRRAVADGLASQLSGYRHIEAASLTEARALIVAQDPVLLLLDLDIPGASGFAGLAAILADRPDLPVAILSASTASGVMAGALAIGARAFFPKSLDLETLARGVAAVLDGEPFQPPDDALRVSDDALVRYATLSTQQRRVLALIADGLLNKQIAARLSISEQRVKEHVTQILRRLEVTTRTAAALIAHTLGSGTGN